MYLIVDVYYTVVFLLDDVTPVKHFMLRLEVELEHSPEGPLS